MHPRCERAHSLACILVGRAAYHKLSRDHRYAQQQYASYIYEDEYRAAVRTYFIWKSPYITQSDCRTYGSRYDA